jgi:integrase
MKTKQPNGKYKMVRVRVGWESEGYSAKTVYGIRSNVIKLREHGITEDVGPTMTFARAAELYLTHSGNKKSIQADISRLHYRIIPFLGDKILNEVTPSLIQKFYVKLTRSTTKHGKLMALATVEHHIKLVRQIFNYLRLHHQYQHQNPADFSCLNRIKFDNTLIRFLNRNQELRLLEVLENYDNRVIANIVTFALTTGMRRSAVLQLRWSSLDLNERTVKFYNSKGDKNEIIPLNSSAFKVIVAQQSTMAKSEFVFTSNDDKAWVNISKHWKKIKELAEIENFRFHDLRHHFATKLRKKGVGVADMKDLLMHKDVSTTLKYAHNDVEGLRGICELASV